MEYVIQSLFKIIYALKLEMTAERERGIYQARQITELNRKIEGSVWHDYVRGRCKQ
jgi:hypothetical protein